MAVEKVTPMVLKVDLQCPCCYKKIKKTLCKFPQIRDQVYDEKANTVAITVVCCSPEKIRDKLCAKGGKVIKGIEMKEPKVPGKGPEKPKVIVIEKPKDAEKPKEKPKEAEKPKEKPKEQEKPKEKPEKADKPKADGKGDKPKANGAPPAEKPKEAAPKPAEPAAAKGPEPVPANGVPSVFPYCGPTYDAYAAGPYYHGYGFPPPPPQPCYEGYYGYGHPQHGYGHAHGYGYGNVNGYGRGGHVTRSDVYFSEENPQGCSIM